MTSGNLNPYFIKMAISLATRNLGKTWPNPSVGCIVVKDGRIVGRGITGEKGFPHAETIALNQAGDLAAGSTLYVTLEPCCHTGNTPPCTTKLVNSKVSRVVCPLKDPDPRVSGKGFEILRAHGIEVDEHPKYNKQAQDLAQGFITRVKLGRPMVTLKLATSIDGKIATQDQDSKWITTSHTRNYVQLLRSKYDAILVGKKTAIVDNPHLSLRNQFSDLNQPIRIILDRKLSLSKDTNLVKTAQYQRLILVHDQKISKTKVKDWNKKGVTTIPVQTIQNKLNLPDLMLQLGSFGITRLLVEGGSELATSLLNEKLIDKIVMHTGGLIIGKSGLPSWGKLNSHFHCLSEHPRFELLNVKSFGEDCEHIWKITY